MRARSGGIASLKNLGPKSVQMLRSAGIRTVAQLQKHGAVEAYVKVRAVDERASLNLLWALEAALTDRAWQDVAKKDRLRLLLAVEECTRPAAGNVDPDASRRTSRQIKRRAPSRRSS
jgi:DNA transformation protein